MSTYSQILLRVKNHIVDKQTEVTDALIKESLDMFKQLNNDYKKYTELELNALFGFGKDFSPLNENDWTRLENEIRSQFHVRFFAGEGLVGNEQKERDTTWWTDEFARKENFYWNRYSIYQDRKIPGIKKTLDRDTSFVLNNIGHPKKEETFSIRGMVVGHVQSGKTSHYSGVICKAADAGYKVIVVIAGDKENLRSQTQYRIDENFVGKTLEEEGDFGVSNIAKRPEKKPDPLTNVKQDFSASIQRFADGFHTHEQSPPRIFVIKKNAYILKNFIKWLLSHGSFIKDIPLLVIDDESDYASVNTGDENDPKTINKLIRGLIGVTNRSSYVAYTATPFANIFIDHDAHHEELGQDLFPKNFIYALDHPDNYFGSKEILQSENSDLYLTEIDDYEDIIPLKHKKDDDLYELPNSCLDAIRWFVIAVAIMNLRGQVKKHKSMLIHISRFTIKHQEIAELVDEYLQELKDDIETNEFNNNCESMDEFERTFIKEYVNKDYYEDGVIVDKEFVWDDIRPEIFKTLKEVEYGEAHSKPLKPLKYDDKNPKPVIAIGGLSLSRGFTVENLVVSYFLRNSVFYDTLMQMARWYGYRSGYQDLCRIYMTFEMMDYFTHIHQATVELMERFKEMQELGRSPEEFGLLVREHPDNILKVTALAKMKNATSEVYNLRLEGTLRETVRLSADHKHLSQNFKAFEKILSLLGNKKERPQKSQTGYIWRDVNNEILLDFVNESHVYDGDGFGLKAKMPTRFVREFIAENKNWDVALFEGDGQKTEVCNITILQNFRKLKYEKEGNFFAIPQRQLSSGTNEAINLPHEAYKELKGDRTKAKEFEGRNNLFMLYLIQRKPTKDSEGELDIDRIVAFGVSLSGSPVISGGSTYLVNSVMMQTEIQEQIDIQKGVSEE